MPPPPTKKTAPNQPGIVDDVHPMTEAEHKECNAIMDAVYAAKEGPRLIATDFHALPDRKRYPDYYEAIPEPVCLDEVEIKLDKKEFTSAQAFVVDLQLVFQNAMHYNEDESSIWKDAKRLDDLVNDLYAAAEEDGVLPPKTPHKITTAAAAAAAAAAASASRTSVPPPTAGSASPAVSSSARSASGATAAGTAAAAASGSSVPPASPAQSSNPAQPAALTLAMLPKKRGRPTKEEAAARAAAGYVKKPARVKTKPAVSAPAPSTPSASGAATPSSTAAAAAVTVSNSNAPPPKVDVSIPWETYIPPSPSKMSEPSLSDQEGATVNHLAVTTNLDERLPRAEGFEVDAGWLADGDEAHLAGLLDKLKTYVDAASGRRFFESLEEVPTQTENQLLSFQGPMSIDLIESQLAAGTYLTPEAFDKDMVRLFEKARRWHPEGSAPYGEVLVLQRYYQDMTSEKPNSTTAATAFSSVPGGPGNARRPMFPGSPDTVATFRIAVKDRTYLDVGVHKGTSFASGDYVHVANADEPAKPIVGQVFKVFKPTKGPYIGQTSVSVCWYFRPEGTIHPASRLFWEGEILKTGYFGDHVLADIIEKVGAQFYSKAIRGRPKAPYWHPGWPLYVVESRYNPKDRQMIKIKNWASCIPEELRKTDFMPIAPFTSIVTLPKRLSPFLRGVTGPGCLGYPERKRAADEESTDGEGKSEAGVEETPGRAPKRLKKEGGKPSGLAAAPGGGGGGTAVGSAGPSGSATPSILAAYASQRPSPALSRRPSAAPGSMAAPALVPAYGAASRPHQQQPPHQQQAQASSSRFPVQGLPHQQQQQPPHKVIDRSVIGNSGGPLWVSKTASQAVVPPAVAARFPSDPATGNLLWFSGPPMHVAPQLKPRHSAAYLAHLASSGHSTTTLAPVEPAEELVLDPTLLGAMEGVLDPDLVARAHEAFAYEFDGLEETEEWRAVMGA